MTATERLRAMLDERGVEWETNDRYTDRWLTRWKSNGIEWRAEEEGMALLLKTVDGIEPEQAIEATLGRGELRKERDALDRLTDVLNATNDGLLAENANLRELVRDMYAVMVEDAANCDVTYPEQFDDRMRELGVEV